MSAKRYRTAKEITIPKGQSVVSVSRMKHEIIDSALAVVRVGQDTHFDWFMSRIDALEAGLIEEYE